MTITQVWTWLPRVAVLGVLLAGCGNEPEDEAFGVIGGAVVEIASAREDAQTDRRALVTRATIEAEPTPLRFMELVDRENVAGLVFLQWAGPPERWAAPDERFALILQNGLVIRTHGLGFDLVAADITDIARALAAGGGENLTRAHRYLTSDNQEVIRSFSCRIRRETIEVITIFERSYETTRFSERCSDAQDSFENLYWIDDEGLIWKSQTWVSNDIGRILIERL